MDKGYSDAVYTVEAAVLLPLILAVLLALIQICFVLHDRVIIREALEYAVLRGTEDETFMFDKDATEGSLLISKITDAQFLVTQRGAEAAVTLESANIVPYFKAGDRFKKIYCAEQKKLYSEEKTIMSEVLLEVLGILQ